MKRKVVSITLVIAVLTLVGAITSLANVPPPPVNQLIGIPDGVLGNMTEADCRVCHVSPGVSPPTGVPVDTRYLPTRHHLLVNQTITCPTAAPSVTCPTTDTYQCLSCHSLVGDPLTFVMFRDCTFCHKQSATGATVHHTTNNALNQNCKACHGLIDNPLDGHYIPTYQKSMVTPRTGSGQTTGPLGPGQGGCAYCHSPGTDTSTGVPITVYNNGDTHHKALDNAPINNLPPSAQGTSCLWCHGTSKTGTPLTFDIRQCEICHGVASLHNIQVDSNANGIVPGQENPYYGHIGSNTDCNGCHLNTSASATALYSGPVIPNVSGLSASNFTAGTDTIITVYGSAFTNTVQGTTGSIELTSNVVLTAADGSTTTLTPIVITESSMDVTIPGTLAAGNYELRAVKEPKASNLVVVSVKPSVVITSAQCSNGVVTIKGSGFSEHVDAVDSGTSVTVTGGKGRKKTTNTCAVNTWNDTQIVANCGTCSGTVEVDSVFGTASQQTNQPPVANAGRDQSTRTNRPVKLNGSASKDPDGKITNYVWNFDDDNSSASGKSVSHKFTAEGTYTVTLTVTDDTGATGTDTAVITVK